MIRRAQFGLTLTPECFFWSTRVTDTINTIQSELGSQRDQGDGIDNSSQVASLKREVAEMEQRSSTAILFASCFMHDFL
jgi:hypothetical protein